MKRNEEDPERLLINAVKQQYITLTSRLINNYLKHPNRYDITPEEEEVITKFIEARAKNSSIDYLYQLFKQLNLREEDLDAFK